MSEHLNHDQLVQYLYDGESGGSHVEACSVCRAEVARREALRTASIVEPSVSSDFLAAQRRAIYSRMGERPKPSRAWIPAFATVALVAAGLYLHQPQRPVSVPQSEVGDAQLFSEIVTLEQTAEPRAAAPIVALFEDNQ